MVLQAALSGLDVQFIDGVLGKDVPENAVPTKPGHGGLRGPQAGSWRAHMNAIQEIVRRNLTSALILEDDTDWDIRLKHQLHDFALSSHALLQPLVEPPNLYADPTYPEPSKDSPGVTPDIPFHHLPFTVPPSTSPYGDKWDLLWLGHRGMHFPFPSNEGIPKGRSIHASDDTVAQKKYLWGYNSPFTLKEKYPDAGAHAGGAPPGRFFD
ncbi:hypothetical protein G7046_g10157 [Stylonectria norvegica]|nr:hypothetical protein G7046_g10157 [Stylonectria norvegica]